jgi:hypothetical protein
MVFRNLKKKVYKYRTNSKIINSRVGKEYTLYSLKMVVYYINLLLLFVFVYQIHIRYIYVVQVKLRLAFRLGLISN